MTLAKIAATAALCALVTGPAVAQDLTSGDATKGERLFARCMACHAVGDDAGNKIGPMLNNLFGREPASVEGFNYSTALKNFAEEHPAWTPELVAEFVASPRTVVQGTMMAFPGLRRPQDQADLLAYLATFDDEGLETAQ